MKINSFLLVLILFIPVCSIAQNDGRGYQNGNGQRNYNRDHRDGDRDRQPGTLSIFSENGDLFQLLVNGISQNAAPVTQIHVEGLRQMTNDIEIIFTDGQTPVIRRQINLSDPLDGKAVNMYLKIVRNREGYAKLKFEKCTDLDYKYRQGSEWSGNGGGNQGQGDNNYTQVTPPPPPPPAGPSPMDATSFNDAKTSISSGTFEQTMMSTAKLILQNNYFTTAQVIEICNLFSFENTRLDFAKAAYSKTVDPANYYKVGNIFVFSSSKEALNNFLSQQH